MISRTPSPPLIKGIDWIVSRPPNKDNYSTLNGNSMGTKNQPGKENSRKYRKYRIRHIYMKQVTYTDKNVNWMEPGNWNEIKVTKMDGEDDGEESGGTGAPQGNKIRRRCGSKS